MKYKVRADMSVILYTIVEASSEDEALALAKNEAENGTMQEIEHSGEVDGWEVFPLANDSNDP